MGRAHGLDGLRGLAVLAMVADHLALFAGLDAVRWTVGRLALPVFFVLAGHLAHRIGWRHLGIGAAGVALAAAVGWVDSPNVLTWYAAGTVVVVLGRRVGLGPAWLLAGALVLLANGVGDMAPGYRPAALLGFMAVGQLVSRARLDRLGAWVPRWVASVGRHPLAWYVGHVVALDWLRYALTVESLSVMQSMSGVVVVVAAAWLMVQGRARLRRSVKVVAA